MYGTLLKDKKGNIESKRSGYNPSAAIRDLTMVVKNADQEGDAVQNATYDEFNGSSFVQQANDSQRRWLSHPDAPYEGNEDWRWHGIRPITRNRVIATAAHLTAQLLYPKTFAQNQDQEEDKSASYAMDALVEYYIRRSSYDVAFLFGVIGALVNPLNFFKVEYCEAWQEAWVGDQKEKVIDEIFSGFQYSLKPMDEIRFGNAYQYDWQKQDWIIEQERVAYEEMEAKFGLHENWAHVQKGVIRMLHEDGYFYDVEDTADNMVGHVKYKHRRTDCEVDFVNGVYLSNPNTEFNPFYHRKYKVVKSKLIEIPMYDTVKYGFEPIDAMRFIGYKSLVDKMSNDQDAVDRQWQDYFDSSRLATFTPLVTMGAGQLDKSVMAPGAVTEIGKKAEIKPVPVSVPAAALSALREAERSATETSIDPQSSGIKEGPEQTKAETLLLQQNSDTNLGITAKMIARMVKDVGGLIVNDIARHTTVGEAGEIVGQMTYQSFVLDGRVSEGKNKTVNIKFTDRYAGKGMTKKEKEMREYEMMSENPNDREICEINPGMFVRLDWLVMVDADQLMKLNTNFERAFKLNAYDRLIQNPIIQRDPEAQLNITRDFLLEPIMKGNASKYLPNIKKIAAQVIPGAEGGKGGYPQKGIPERAMGAAAGSGMV